MSFVKRHSSAESFVKYCGNSWGALKAAFNSSEVSKTTLSKCGSKAILFVARGLGIEHTIHKPLLGQVYKYETEKYLNYGNHPTGKPFVYKIDNKVLLLDTVLKRK